MEIATLERKRARTIPIRLKTRIVRASVTNAAEPKTAILIGTNPPYPCFRGNRDCSVVC